MSPLKRASACMHALILMVCLWQAWSAQANTPQTLDSEPMVTNRIKLPSFCFGPAPFPINLDHLDFDMFGSAHVLKGSMRLTDAGPSQRGAIWSKRPITNKNNFQIDLRFQVGGSPNLEHFGDGFAFWIIKERGDLGTEALGGPDKFTGLGVFFDTFKNDAFRSKKHPWVYGHASKEGTEGVEYKRLNDLNTQGCHVPFRDSDPKILATTVARITLMNGVLSIVLRPKGAVDWLQCFELTNVVIPDDAYIGVSAMTGGLIDNHHFLQLTTYSNVEVQPFSYAHAFKVTQMPDMWRQMKESGKIAREFEDWEENDSFTDDLSWTISNKVKSHSNDDYDDSYQEKDDSAYGGDNSDPYKDYDESDDPYEANDDDEDEDDAEEGDSKKEKPMITRPKTQHLTPEQSEMARNLDVVLQRSPIHDLLKRQHQKNADMMENIHIQLQKSMQEAADQTHRAAREIRVKEHELSERILAVSSRLKVLVIDPFEIQVVEKSRSWFWPFVIVIILLAALAIFGYTRYRLFMKHKVL